MDKLGHCFSAYHLTKQANQLYTHSGTPKKRALIYSSIYSTLFQTSFEILDGFQSEYGFSFADVGANTLGTLLYTGQELLWQEQKIKIKFSYAPSALCTVQTRNFGLYSYRTNSERLQWPNLLV